MEGEEEEEKGWTFIKTMAGDYKRAECDTEWEQESEMKKKIKKGERDITCQEYDKISIE